MQLSEENSGRRKIGKNKLSLSTWTVKSKYDRVGGLNNRHSFSHNSGVGEIQVRGVGQSDS